MAHAVASSVEEDLRAELLRRSAADQEARERLLAFPIHHMSPPPKEAEPAIEALQTVDEDNTAWLKAIVQRRGWPGRALVGEAAASAAWLLVQHADHDAAFQRECLGLMEKAVERGEASVKDWAYLTDRVLRAEGRPQRYGTQFTDGPEGFEPQPLEHPERVDERRASVGLGPLAEYRQQIIRQNSGASAGQAATPPLATGPLLASCRSGTLEVRVRSYKLPRALRALRDLRPLRPKPEAVEHEVLLPRLPEGCVPCRYGPGLGATLNGEVVLSWFESRQPPSQPEEVFWLHSELGSPDVEPTKAGGRPAIWISGTKGDWRTIVVTTEEGKRYVISGTLARDDLLQVAATLPR
jgi:hypothetical protein